MIKTIILILTTAFVFVNKVNAQSIDLYSDGFGPADCALRSLVLPGWGQIHSGHKVKGRVIMGLEAVGLAASYYYYRKADKNYDKYIREGVKDSSLYSDYEKNTDNSRTALISCAVVWLYSIADAYYSAEPKIDISLDFGVRSIRLRLSKAF